MDLLYNILMIFVAVVGLPLFAFRFLRERRFRERLRHNLGFFQPETLVKIQGRRPVWFQAASVGEVVAASSIIKEFKRQLPNIPVLISSGTASGYEMAQRILPEADAIIYYPPDLPWLPGRIVERIQPRAYVPVETELWPNFIRAARKRSIPVIMVNGRIGERSVEHYRQLRRMFTKMLETVVLFCMQSTIDAQYVIRLGADPHRVVVTGNTKYDQNYSSMTEAEKAAFLSDLGFTGNSPIIVAGSTHRGEEEILMEVLRDVHVRIPTAKLLLAPRDIPRSESIVDLSRRQGFTTELRSKMNLLSNPSAVNVVVLDTIGELGRLYALAELVFIGGSLVPHGGHNILEPAAHGKPIIVGPHMFNFKDTYALFTGRDACATVLDGRELSRKIIEILLDRTIAERMGQEAAAIVVENQGAAARTVENLKQILAEQGGKP
ncbi:MAG TPA: 3-deoxy-D-manno-octulosonic acid transferase [Negativicutes bacterium]|nr:3-deoxy-D-manno-octulosonic acid transferase [Negativicutes bacterium]